MRSSPSRRSSRPDRSGSRRGPEWTSPPPQEPRLGTLAESRVLDRRLAASRRRQPGVAGGSVRRHLGSLKPVPEPSLCGAEEGDGPLLSAIRVKRRGPEGQILEFPEIAVASRELPRVAGRKAEAVRALAAVPVREQDGTWRRSLWRPSDTPGLRPGRRMRPYSCSSGRSGTRPDPFCPAAASSRARGSDVARHPEKEGADRLPHAREAGPPGICAMVATRQGGSWSAGPDASSRPTGGAGRWRAARSSPTPSWT